MTDRKDILDALAIVAPAIAAKPVLPILAHVCFEAEYVTAYNDVIAIRTPLAVGFEGAVPGATLIGLLEASKAKLLRIEAKPTELLITAAKRTNIKLPLLTPDCFVFKMPAKSGVPTEVEPLLPAIEHCMKSVGTDTTRTEQTGITFLYGSDGLSIYSTDNATMCHARLADSPIRLDRRVILPGVFCKELAKMGNDGTTIAFGNDHAIARNGDTYLFTRLIAPDKPLDYEKIFTFHKPKGLQLYDVPRNIAQAIERACIIAEGADMMGRRTTISVDKGVMQFDTKSTFGEASDNVDTDQQEKVTITTEAKYLKGCEDFETMAVTKDAIVFVRGDMTYMVAAARGVK